MKIKVENSGPCRKTLRVEIPAPRGAAEWQRVLDAWSASAALPGFRRGRAPRALVASRFARELREAVQERLVAGSFSQALEQAGLAPVATLKLEAQLAPDHALSYQVVLDVPPEFKLPAYKGLTLKSELPAVGDEDVSRRLAELLDQLADYAPVAGRPLRAGDLAQVDFEGACDGQPVSRLGRAVAGLGSGRDFWVRTDDHAFLPGFDTGLSGMAVGETREIDVRFPDRFSVAALAGRPAKYRVTLKAIREKHLPALTPELLQKFGAASADDLRARLRAALEEEARQRENHRLQSEICRRLLEKTRMDLPESVVREQTRTLFANLVRARLLEGASREQVQDQRGQLESQAAGSAAEKVKLGYILHRIAEEENITVGDDELQEEIRRLAERYRLPPEELREKMQTPDELDALRRQIRGQKTLDWILAQARFGEEKGFFRRLVGT